MRTVIVVLLMLVGCLGSARADAQAPLDVVFALDNSGSMQTNDPRRLLHEAVKAFAGRLGSADHLGIVSFDQGVHPLIELAEVSPNALGPALRKINYKGAWTDIPGGLEAARYELEHHGRGDAQKVIVLITDGGIDLGTPQKDRERKDWLASAVMPAILAQNVRVFGIAVAKDADVELIQRMTTATGGTYYHVTGGGELQGVFDAITARLQDLRAREKVAAEAARNVDADHQRLADESARLAEDSARLAQREAASADTDRRLVKAAQEADVRASAERRLIIWSSLAGVAVLGAIISMIVLKRRGGGEVVPAARLMDVSGQTGSPEHEIRRTITRIGRLEGQEIRIDADGVSRTHAVIEYKDGCFWLRDLRSKNHTYLNNQQLSGDDTRGRMLKHGDELRFGPYLFVFLVDDLVRVEQGENPVMATRLFTGTAVADQSPPQEYVTRSGQVPDLGGVTGIDPSSEPRLTILKPRPDTHDTAGSDAGSDMRQSSTDKVA